MFHAHVSADTPQGETPAVHRAPRCARRPRRAPPTKPRSYSAASAQLPPPRDAVSESDQVTCGSGREREREKPREHLIERAHPWVREESRDRCSRRSLNEHTHVSLDVTLVRDAGRCERGRGSDAHADRALRGPDRRPREPRPVVLHTHTHHAVRSAQARETHGLATPRRGVRRSDSLGQPDLELPRRRRHAPRAQPAGVYTPSMFI